MNRNATTPPRTDPKRRPPIYSKTDWLLGGLALLLIAATVTLHYLTVDDESILGSIWPKVLFLPVLLAGWRFGLIGGAAAALIGSAALTPQSLYYLGELDSSGWEDLSELLVLNLVGWTFGLLSEFHRRRSLEAVGLARELGSANAELAELVDLRDRAARIEKLESVNRLAGGVAHELRNPLAAIKTTVQVTPKENLPRDVVEALRVIEEEVGRADAAVKKLLGRSRRSPESGRILLGELVDEAVALIRPSLGGVELVTNLSEGCAVKGDAEALKQAVVNLLTNAVEAAAKRIDVTLTSEGNRAVIRVTDDGPGIGEGDRKRLFEPFFTSKPGGTGLGLFLARQAVQTHEGSIRHLPDEEGGTVFEIRLPLAKTT